MLFDLHSHTTASDGRLTPAELVKRATDFRVDVLAITDHDTVAGLESAQQAIDAQNLALKLVKGIEISTVWNNFDIHIVGLNIDPAHADLVSLIAQQAERRTARAVLMGERLAKSQIAGAYEGARALAGDATLTRAHFARWLVEQGHAKTMQAVFKKFLTRGNTGYVPPNWCSIAATGDAIEVAQPQQAQNERRTLAEYAEQFGLLSSQGSDFHYPSPWTELGRNLWLPKASVPVWQDWGME